MINSLPLNPAFAGSRDALSVSINYRKQWVNFSQSPSTGTISIHAPSRNTNLGYGLLLINDEVGVSRQSGFMGNFAYQLKTNRGKLNFGISGGLFNYKNAWSEIETTEESDEVFSGGDQSFWGTNFSAGLYYFERNFYASLSMPFIMGNQYKRTIPIETDIYDSPASYNMFFTTGYKIETRGALDFVPSVMFKYIPGSPIQVDANCLVEYNNLISVGASYRHDDALIAIVKYQINEKFSIGYGVDFSMNEIRNYNQGSHEVTLLFDMINHTNSKSAKFF